MIRISDTVREILFENGFVLEAMQKGLLNISAYAKQIHKTVEERAMKPVALGTIVVSLTRIMDSINKQTSFTPKIKLLNLSVTSAISEVTYEKTTDNQEKAGTLNNSIINGREFFTITEGLHEITILCSEESRDSILQHFKSEPKAVLDDLVAVSVRFSSEYMSVPNTIYSLVGALAIKHINVIEIVSTYTELTFIVYKKEMEQTIRALDIYSRK